MKMALNRVSRGLNDSGQRGAVLVAGHYGHLPRLGHGLRPATRYRITNGFPIGSLDRFIQMVLGRV